jgi:hypothetical protein
METDRKQLKSLQPSIGVRYDCHVLYSWWQLGEVECVPNSKPAEGGWKLVMHMAVVAATNYKRTTLRSAQIEQIMIWRRFATEQPLSQHH